MNIKGYVKNLLAEWGEMTVGKRDAIDGGDREMILDVLKRQKDKIIKRANELPASQREVTITQADSVQEVVDKINSNAIEI